MAPHKASTSPTKAFLETPASRVEGRRQPRRALRLDTSGALGDGQQANVTVHNISPAGLLIESDLALAVGEVLTVDLPDEGPVGAEIVWQSGRLFGCGFEQALGEAALAAAQLRGGAPVIPAPHTQGFGGEAVAASTKPFGAAVAASLGSKLNRLRRGQGLTLAQVADALGVSKPTVWAWEKGKARPLPERIDAIAEVLGVPSAELSESVAGTPGSVLVAECRERLAQAYGVDQQSVRIMIEV